MQILSQNANIKWCINTWFIGKPERKYYKLLDCVVSIFGEKKVVQVLVVDLFSANYIYRIICSKR